jgi:D-alanyl-lipoteichoic acid acyltransferase DltB (MBOAT superfamily)
VVLLAVFIALKTPAITEQLSFQIRRVGDQAVGLASHTDLRWLGFSYLAFRMLHTFRDRQSGRLPVSNLREYISYALFFPALTAGPIDRIEHFLDEIGTKGRILPEDFIHGLRRLTIGLFKKFVVADTIGLIALSPALAEAVTSTGWIWITVYAFAVQIYLDFSGYTDIAIGMGLIAGIRLPENFNKPYLRPNLTLFWANWHMTLTQWFRSYFFNPLTRRLRRSKVGYSTGAIILTTQVLTMLLIGLWHGVTWNFAIWGLWHGFGLFVQNRYSEWARLNGIHFGQGTLSKKLATAGSTLLTFHYVALGWVWFALPDTAEAWNVFLILFGIR